MNYQCPVCEKLSSTSLDLVGLRYINGIELAFTTNSAVTNLGAGARVLELTPTS